MWCRESPTRRRKSVVFRLFSFPSQTTFCDHDNERWTQASDVARQVTSNEKVKYWLHFMNILCYNSNITIINAMRWARLLAGSTLHSISEHETTMECQLSMMMGKKSRRRGKSCEFWQSLVKKVNLLFSIIKRYVSSAIKVVSFSILSFSAPRRRYMYVNNYNPKSQLEIPSCRPRATITRRQTVYFALSHVPMLFWNSRPVFFFSVQFNLCSPSICARRSRYRSHI